MQIKLFLGLSNRKGWGANWAKAERLIAQPIQILWIKLTFALLFSTNLLGKLGLHVFLHFTRLCSQVNFFSVQQQQR